MVTSLSGAKSGNAHKARARFRLIFVHLDVKSGPYGAIFREPNNWYSRLRNLRDPSSAAN